LINAGGGLVEGNRERHLLEFYNEIKEATRGMNMVSLFLVVYDYSEEERK
jgi:hypothetical protein